MTCAMCSGQVTFTLCGQGLLILEGATYYKLFRLCLVKLLCLISVS